MHQIRRVQRISLQFYVHLPEVLISEIITDDRFTKQFLGVFFTLLMTRLVEKSIRLPLSTTVSRS